MQRKLFRTVVEVPESPFKLDYNTSSLWIGSCFTENIGARLGELKFRHAVNPFGILYNPASIENSISILMEGKKFTADDLVNHNGLWFSFSHHTSYSHPDRDVCLDMINSGIENSAGILKNAHILFLTFGTARVYSLRETGRIVSNCHKLPHGKFRHFLLDVDKIVESYNKLVIDLTRFNPDIRIVFTVSPVRHWKDGPVGNQVSKSTLILAIERLRNMFENVSYFPAYEIVMDELRDYRFYDEDMLHINAQGVGYIWERFKDAFIASEAIPFMKEIYAIRQGLSHRPFNPSTPQHHQFLAGLLERIKNIGKELPGIDFSREEEIITTRLGG